MTNETVVVVLDGQGKGWTGPTLREGSDDSAVYFVASAEYARQNDPDGASPDAVYVALSGRADNYLRSTRSNGAKRRPKVLVVRGDVQPDPCKYAWRERTWAGDTLFATNSWWQLAKHRARPTHPIWSVVLLLVVAALAWRLLAMPAQAPTNACDDRLRPIEEALEQNDARWQRVETLLAELRKKPFLAPKKEDAARAEPAAATNAAAPESDVDDGAEGNGSAETRRTRTIPQQAFRRNHSMIPATAKLVRRAVQDLRTTGAGRIEIVVHNDDAGSASGNLISSERRASKIEAQLRETIGNVPEISARGAGEAEPVCKTEGEPPNEANGEPAYSAECRVENKRIEVIAFDEAQGDGD